MCPKLGGNMKYEGQKLINLKKNKKKQAGAELQKKKKYFLGEKLGKI